MRNSRSYFGRSLAFMTAVVAMILCLGLTGCKNDDDSSTIVGTWTSSYGEEFVIDTSTLSNSYSGNECYSGDNAVVSFTTSNSGYIYIKYTNAFNEADVGKWYAVSFKNLTAESVQLSGAYKKDNGKSSCDTLEECKKIMTIENGYFATYSDCIRQ